jgi:hypothetical protein
MRRLLCWIGLHRWAYGGAADAEDDVLTVYRICARCERSQWTDWRDDDYMVRWIDEIKTGR